MTLIVNRVRECYDGRGHLMPIGDIRAVVVHRTDLKLMTEANPHPIPDAELEAVGLCRSFQNHGLGTGGRPPYHVLIRCDGVAEQMLPLSIAGAHCISWNRRSIGVAVVGDFRFAFPSPAQWEKLCGVVASLMPLNGGLDIVGHDAVPGGSGDPNKRCPGKYLNPWAVEMEAAKRLDDGWKLWSAEGLAAELASAGWVL